MQGHQLSAFKPTSVHWTSFAKQVIELAPFTHFLQMAAQQSIWQFTNVLPLLDVSDSTQSAKENSVFSLIYINLARIVLGQMLPEDGSPILSLDFLTKMAKIDDANEMKKFVEEDFIPLIKSPSALGLRIPNLKRVYDATSHVMKFMSANQVSFIVS